MARRNVKDWAVVKVEFFQVLFGNKCDIGLANGARQTEIYLTDNDARMCDFTKA